MLQWGHAFVSVETSSAVAADYLLQTASMGPRFCKRGNEQPSKRKPYLSELQWGHAFVSVETDKAISGRHVARIVLQWGHAFVSVETSRAYCRALPLMMSLQWGHAFVSVETASRTVGQVYHLSSPLRPEVVRQAHILAG